MVYLRQGGGMNRLKNYFRIFAAASVLLVLAASTVLKSTLSVLGYATAPDDAKVVISRWPAVLKLIAETPWPVFAALMFAGLILATWLLVTGVKSLVAQQKLTLEMPAGYMTEEQARHVLEWVRWFRHEWVGEKERFLSDAKEHMETVSRLIHDNREIHTSAHLAISSLPKTLNMVQGYSLRNITESVGKLSGQTADIAFSVNRLSHEIEANNAKMGAIFEALERQSPPGTGPETPL
jgi:uncharacterized membrane protein